jgi:hypothetical protein
MRLVKNTTSGSLDHLLFDSTGEVMNVCFPADSISKNISMDVDVNFAIVKSICFSDCANFQRVIVA